MRLISTITALALITSVSMAEEAVDYQKQIDDLTKKLTKLEKTQKREKKKLAEVKAHDAHDNIKFGVDFRNTFETVGYKDNKSGVSADNNLFTSRLYLDMAASPMDGLVFKGQLAIYSTWGAHIFDESTGLKDWSGSSHPTDTIMRVREAYFLYSSAIGEQPISFSVGRRPATDGFLANYRENKDKPGSPLAHITNMEVNAMMVMLNWDRFIPGAYTKFVYGRAHTGDNTGVYGLNKEYPADLYLPYALTDKNNGDDQDVDFFVVPGQAYDDGQYKVMYQWAHIFNTKGQKYNEPATKKAAAGTADLFSAGLVVSGIGDEISDFLDETTVFVSGAYTNYSAKDGYQLFGSEDGGSKDGSSIWLGAVVPDMITEDGKFGIEYNHGSQYWTPMTWAEDTTIGSKIAVRGDAYEAYWNFNLFGVKYLPSQVRYTYVQHDYTPNIKCAGWVPAEEVDITAQNLRFAVTYRY
ncbi:MAG: DUF3373 family protein [Campylobacterota bacterium]|nr:DUF3373 family protein [Campylobacterota bacterium]